MMAVHSVVFVRMNGHWVAQIFIDANTCVSWQTIRGGKRAVRRVIAKQLTPAGIPYTIDD